MTFTVKYNTRFGEDIHLIFDGKDCPMRWNEGGIWSVETDLGAFAGNASETVWKSYHYELKCAGVTVRTERTGHRLNVTDALAGDRAAIHDFWYDRDESYYRSVHSVFGPYGTRVAGVAVPVFSLRSRNSFGVGEFPDLKLLVDFAVSTGMHCIQLLPVNDTTRSMTWDDSYPYSACSSFALHPQFANLEMMGLKADAAYRKLRNGFNDCEFVDYENVNRAKDKYMRGIYKELGAQQKRTPSFRKFIKENSFWLLPYACFRLLTEQKRTADFSCWDEMAEYSAAKVKKFYAAHKDAVEYHMWVQWHLDCQFCEVAEYARSLGVHFKGDLPIGVGRYSADSWEHPELFNMDSSAGAPPDFFSRDGQNWGFPTYNWEKMEEDGFKWWKSRLANMSRYFDAYRIDHILGFFRIWEIPYRHESVAGTAVSGMYGHFNPSMSYSLEQISYFDYPGDGQHHLFLEYPRQQGGFTPLIGAMDTPAYRMLDEHRKRAFDYLYNDFFYHRHNEMWKSGAIRKLKALTECSDMLACGEDLGMMADCVPEVMDMYHILSLELPRMPKGIGREFADPADFPHMSVATTSTHDMSPMRLWWNQCPAQAQRYYNDVLRIGGTAPDDTDVEISSSMVRSVLDSPSMLCVIPLQDWLACSEFLRCPVSRLAQEQINDPSNGHHHWRYRMDVKLEDMTADTKFTDTVRALIADSGR